MRREGNGPLRAEPPHVCAGARPAGEAVRTVRIQQLAIFCRVYEDGTVSAAAAAMFISQPAASMQLHALEEELGAPLLERQGRRLVPTAAGELFYGYASTLVQVWEEAEQAVANLREGQTGAVLLGASTTGVLYHLPPLLRAFRAKLPGGQILLQCDTTDRVCSWLLRRRVEVGLVWGPVAQQGINAETICESEFALILPADSDLALATREGETVSAEQLAAMPFVFQESGTSTRRFVEGALHRAGVDPVEAMSLRSTEEVKQAVEAGLGAGVVARKAVLREVAAGAMVIRQLPRLQLARPLVLITRQEGDLLPAVRRFVQFVRDEGAALLV